MGKVNVLVVSSLHLQRDYLEDIAAVHSRISVKDGTEQFLAELRRKGIKGPLADRLEEQLSLGREWQVPEVQDDLEALLTQAEVIFEAVQ